MLERRFSGSPRVALILGLRFEALGETAKAKKVYDELLSKDETNVVRGRYTATRSGLRRRVSLNPSPRPSRPCISGSSRLRSRRSGKCLC